MSQFSQLPRLSWLPLVIPVFPVFFVVLVVLLVLAAVVMPVIPLIRAILVIQDIPINRSSRLYRSLRWFLLSREPRIKGDAIHCIGLCAVEIGMVLKSSGVKSHIG